MRPLLATSLLFLCLSAQGQGGSVVGNVNSLIGGELLCADGALYSDGSPAGYPNCLYMPQPEEYLNGYVITWPSVTNHPTLAPYDRTLIYDLYIATNSSAWVLVQEIAPAPSDPMHLVWVPKDYWFGSGPTPTNVYFTVKASLLDATNVPTPAWAYWQYSTNCIGCQTNDPTLSTGAENVIPGFRMMTNWGPQYLVSFNNGGSIGDKSAFETNYGLLGYGRHTLTFSTQHTPPVNTNHCTWWIDPSWYFVTDGSFNCGRWYNDGYALHELGEWFFSHAMSMQRSGSDFVNINPLGDSRDVMCGVGEVPFKFNSFFLECLGWLGPYGNRPLMLAARRVTGIYTFGSNIDQNPGPKSLKIPRMEITKYSYVGGLWAKTNIFYYLDIEPNFGYATGEAAVIVRVGTPKPYASGVNMSGYSPASYWVSNYGHSGGMISGDYFDDNFIVRTLQQTGPSPAPIITNDVAYPFTVRVVSVNLTSATVTVSFQQ